MAGARLGQNFLVDPRVADKMIDFFLPVQGPILEIGPGRGILTDRLIQKSEQKITAVELDGGLCEQLKGRLESKTDVICGDILDVRLERLFPSRPVNIIGNLPYYLSKELVDWLIQNGRMILKGVVMLQKEFVRKLVIGQNEQASSAQSAMFHQLFSASPLFSVRPGSFSPRPRVTSTVLEITRKSDDRDVDVDFYRFLKSCFRQQRKTLANNLLREYPPDRIREVSTALGLSSTGRAEEISASSFLRMYLLLKER